jgi:hypothetical protein
MIRNYQHHSNKVKDWIDVATPGLSSPQLIKLFELAVTKLWLRSCVTIGDVTVLAIVDRALTTCDQVHKVSIPLSIGPDGILWDEFRQLAANLSKDEIIRALTYFATEFIAIASSITGEFLSAPLHKELASVTMKKKNI